MIVKEIRHTRDTSSNGVNGQLLATDDIIDNININTTAATTAFMLHEVSIDNAEYLALNGVNSSLQSQLNCIKTVVVAAFDELRKKMPRNSS